MIKSICFDADGVLVNPAFQFSRHLQEVHNITMEMTAPFFGGVFSECLLGRKQIQNELPPYLAAWGWQDGVDSFIQTWLEQDNVVDRKLIHTVQQLRKARFHCCLTTNQEQNRAAYMRNRMGFGALFDMCFISCEMGTQKPDPAYYRHIQNKLQLAPQEILFWDDSAGHVEAAKKQGWHAEVYNHYEPFTSLMKEKYAINWQE
jgi:putative hydrolase of the HAD superfamily